MLDCLGDWHKHADGHQRGIVLLMRQAGQTMFPNLLSVGFIVALRSSLLGLDSAFSALNQNSVLHKSSLCLLIVLAANWSIRLKVLLTLKFCLLGH